MANPVTTIRGRKWRSAVTFCLIGIMLFWGVDRSLWWGLRRARANEFSVWDALVGGRLGADLVITGASRALVGIDCDILGARLSSSCFNLGLDGSQLNLQRPYVETYLRHNRPPKLAVVNLDVGSLGESTAPYDLAQYVPYLDEPPIAAGLSRYVDVWKYRAIPLYAFTQVGLNQVLIAMHGVMSHPDATPWRLRAHGFRPTDKSWDSAFDEFVAENPRGARLSIDGVGIAELERLIFLLESGGARVILISSPEWEGIRSLELNRDEVMRTFAAIAARHHVTFIDYSDSALGRDKSLFYNSQHLNRKGATLFTAVLGDDLLNALSSAPALQAQLGAAATQH